MDPTNNELAAHPTVTAIQNHQPRSFWQTNRGVIALCFFVLELLFFATDSIGVPAHAYVSGDVGGTPYISVWFMVSFLVPAALVMPLVGGLKARYGVKTLATLAPGLFGLACVMSSMATDPQLFMAMRVVQGLGGGFIPAIAGGYLGGALGEDYNPMGKGLVALAGISGSAIGIPASALITWNLSWRFMYVAIGLIALVAVVIIASLMPRTPGDPAFEIDWLGYGFMAGGFGLLALSLVVGNQREWFADPVYVLMLWTSIVLLGLFGWRITTEPKLIDTRIFKDINYCISLVNLSSVLFFLFMAFAIVPRFLMIATHNTIENYAITFIPFVAAAIATGILITPRISPCLIGRNTSQKKWICSAGILAFALTTLWIAHTNSQQSNVNVGLQLVCVGICFAVITGMEIQMALTTMAAELMVSAGSVLFFCTNISKAISGGVSNAILTVTTQGSWTRFREHIHPSNPAMEPFLRPFQGHSSGITGNSWSQGSLELINQQIARQAEVVAFINIATVAGLVLLLLCALPLLHRSPEKVTDKGKSEPQIALTSPKR